VALRRFTLYPAQVPRLRDSPVHRGEHIDVLSKVRVEQAMTAAHARLTFLPQTRAPEILRRIGDSEGHESIPVADAAGALVGLIRAESLLVLAGQPEGLEYTIAADVMEPPLFVRPTDDLRHASRLMLQRGLHELPVVEGGLIVGYLHEAAIARIYIESGGHTGVAESAADAE
jgi:CIC family chloride channel protein